MNPRENKPATFESVSRPIQMLLIWVPVLLGGWAVEVISGDFAEVFFAAISDAYLQVSAFVAVTFLLFYGIEKLFKVDAAALLQEATFWQVPIAAGLGALPGCGGAVIVMTQYVSGRLSFGAVVAVLTATMGDAAFLLIAQVPLTGLSMIGLGFVIGTLSGWIVNKIHASDFLYDHNLKTVRLKTVGKDTSSPFLDLLWFLLLAPGLILAFLVAFQVDVDSILSTEVLSKPATTIGVMGGLLAISMQLAPKLGLLGDDNHSKQKTIFRKTIRETNFITLWVICAYLAFELPVYFFDIDLQSIFAGWAAVVPLISVLIGFLPGCGPQVLVTTLFIAGYLPLSAQIGNALSNDGDALFPAIAIAPKVAIVATFYSAIPALVASYVYFFAFE
tara:strand:+ start:12 stop:1178 length:1167 start_codon:yes stop_codon:yes gene_type:complete